MPPHLVQFRAVYLHVSWPSKMNSCIRPKPYRCFSFVLFPIPNSQFFTKSCRLYLQNSPWARALLSISTPTPVFQPSLPFPWTVKILHSHHPASTLAFLRSPNPSMSHSKCMMASRCSEENLNPLPCPIGRPMIWISLTFQRSISPPPFLSLHSSPSALFWALGPLHFLFQLLEMSFPWLFPWLMISHLSTSNSKIISSERYSRTIFLR